MSNGDGMFHRNWKCGCGTDTGQCQSCSDREDAAEQARRDEEYAEAMAVAPPWYFGSEGGCCGTEGCECMEGGDAKD